MINSDEVLGFVKVITSKFPEAKVEIDEPCNPQGDWWIDINNEGLNLNVIWKDNFGFGLFTEEGNGYGERPNETHRNYISASKRISQIIKKGKRRDNLELSPADVRELRDLKQVDVASLLKVRQASISKLENHKGDVKVKTLAEYIAAIGGRLELKVHFPEFDASIRPSSFVDE